MSVSRSRRPSREVQLVDLRPAVDFSPVDDLSFGFVHDLLDDAVDDFADDVVVDVDESHPLVLSLDSSGDAKHVLSPIEPVITEFEEEEDHTWAAATAITEVAAQQALNSTDEKDTESTKDSTQDLDNADDADDYESVYSYEGDADEAEDIDEGIEQLVYSKMASTIARNALNKGCEVAPRQQEVILDEVPTQDEAAFDFACNILDGAIGEAAQTAWQYADGADDVVDEAPPPLLPLEETRLKARQQLLKFAATGELEQKLKAMQLEKKLKDIKKPLEDEINRKAQIAQALAEAASATGAVNVSAALGLADAAACVAQEASMERPVDVEALRLQAKQSLLQASEGALSEIVQKIQMRRQQSSMDVKAPFASFSLCEEPQHFTMATPPDSAREHKSSNEEKPIWIAQTLRTNLQQGLQRAAEAGKLQEVLCKETASKQVPQVKDESDRKAKMAQYLSEAASATTASNPDAAAGLAQAAACVAQEVEQDRLAKIAQGLSLAAKAIIESNPVASAALARAATCVTQEGRTAEVEQVATKTDSADVAKKLNLRAVEALEQAYENGGFEKAVTEMKSARQEKACLADAATEKSAPSLDMHAVEEVAETTHSEDVREGLATPTSRHIQYAKTKRRIIGGVVRAPTPSHAEHFAAPTSSRSGESRRRHAKKEHKQLKLDTESFGFPAFDRPASSGSKTSSRLRKTVSMSALAMDLGDVRAPTVVQPPPPSSYNWQEMLGSSSISSSSAFAPVSFTTTLEKSSSLGSLRPKSKGSGLLPSLPSKQSNTASIAWSMEMSQPSLKRRGIGHVF